MDILRQFWSVDKHWDDWRVKAVVAAVGVSLAITLLIYLFAYLFAADLNPSTHFGSAFASWVGGLALFIVAGSVVALVSLVKPENESFDARARILFRKKTGSHIDYIVHKIKNALEHYAEQTTLTFTITDYDSPTKLYRVEATSDTIVRSYIDDVETTYVSLVSRSKVATPPQDGKPNRLVYARVAGTPVGTTEEFQSEISRTLSCQIEANKACEVSLLTEFWIAADVDANTHTPQRYTQRLTLSFENLINSGQPVRIKITTNKKEWQIEQLPHGRVKKILDLVDVPPHVATFDFRILAPDTSDSN